MTRCRCWRRHQGKRIPSPRPSHHVPVAFWFKPAMVMFGGDSCSGQHCFLLTCIWGALVFFWTPSCSAVNTLGTSILITRGGPITLLSYRFLKAVDRWGDRGGYHGWWGWGNQVCRTTDYKGVESPRQQPGKLCIHIESWEEEARWTTGLPVMCVGAWS